MKILQVLPYAENGGTEKAVALLTEGLITLGHKVTVLSPQGPALKLFSQVEHLEMPKKLIKRNSLIRQVAADFDLVHIHAARELVRDYGIPIVFTPHSYYNRLDVWMVKLFASQVDVVCFTNWEASLLKSLGINKIHVIPNGIKEPPILAHTTSAVPRIGYLGRLTKDKGVDLLIKEVARINLPYELLIAGEGKLEDDLKQLAKELKVPVRFVGRVEPNSFLAGIDIFVLPSRTETFGLALVEAMALGLPCVTSNVCGLPEIVADTGLAVPHGSLATAITKLLADKSLRKDLGTKARNRFLANFSFWGMVKATEELYLEVITPRKYK